MNRISKIPLVHSTFNYLISRKDSLADLCLCITLKNNYGRYTPGGYLDGCMNCLRRFFGWIL